MSKRLLAMLPNLVAARKARRLSQEAVAAQLGITQSHYSKIERGEVGLSAAHALILTRTLEISLESLLVSA